MLWLGRQQAGSGTVLSCVTAGIETLGIGCFVGAGGSVAGGAVLVHGLAVTAVSLGNGYQNAMSLMSGSSANGRSFNDILGNDELFMRWLKRAHPADQPLSASQAKAVWDKLEELGLSPRLDRTGNIGTYWKAPHINVQVGGTNVHIPVSADFNP